MDFETAVVVRHFIHYGEDFVLENFFGGNDLHAFD